MAQLLNFLQWTPFINNSSSFNLPSFTFVLCHRKTHFYSKRRRAFLKHGAKLSSLQADLVSCGKLLETADDRISPPCKGKDCNGQENNAFPSIQGLTQFPKDELFGKAVIVRFDSIILLSKESSSFNVAVSTLKYLHDCGAKVILVSNWSVENNLELVDAKSVAVFLSEVLQLKVAPAKLIPRTMSRTEDAEKYDILLLENLSLFKEEHANCSKFSEDLSKGIDIFVNDTFSQSHRIMASTVGITRFCYACVAGFHFEEHLHQLKKTVETSATPYMAIIGGSKLLDKVDALHFLASRSDGMVFVGMMAFQMMQAHGLPVPVKFLEPGAAEEASKITQIAKQRSIPILCPKDFWCMNDHFSCKLELFPGHSILEGWEPVDIGPESLEEIFSLISKCKKILWIGPVQFSLRSHHISGAFKLAKMLDNLSRMNCDVIVVGNMACRAVKRVISSVSTLYMVENASIVWAILKGKKLPGLMALDRAYPFEIDWTAAYADPARPLVVDIGSGNGLFLFGMGRRRKDLNFLGLEINEKLVSRCLASVRRSGMKNGFFIATNATSTLRSIVSSYPGKLVLVSIQCPDPDFNRPGRRWTMLQRLLVEAIVDLLTSNGKVFLQSDIEVVAARMKEQFLQYGKGKLALRGGWLKENPFGVQSDWERHVTDRGDPMYRLMLYKSVINE